MDNEEFLLTNWKKFWLKNKKRKIAQIVDKFKSDSLFFSSPSINDDGMVKWIKDIGYSNLNLLTLSQFIVEFHDYINLANKKILLMQNINKPNFIYEAFSSVANEFGANLFVTKHKQKTCYVIVKEIIKRINVDYAFYFYEQNKEIFMEIYNGKGEKINDNNLTEAINNSKYQNIDIPKYSFDKTINIDQSLIIEDYIEKIIRKFSGNSLYDEPLVNIFVYKNNTEYNQIFKIIGKKMNWKIRFSKLLNKNIFNKFLNWFYVRFIEKQDLIFNYSENFVLPEIKMLHNTTHKTIQINNLIGSFLDYFLEDQKRLNQNNNDINLELDIYTNNFVKKIINKYKNLTLNKGNNYLFKKEEEFISLSNDYINDNIPFIFKFIQYVNYLKNQNINFSLRWKNLFKIYGDYFEIKKSFKFKKVDHDVFMESIKNIFANSQFELLEWERTNNKTKLVFDHDVFAVIYFDDKNQKYNIFININKNQQKFKKKAKNLFKIIERSIIESE
ncbi:hypothetical protein [Mycoplasma elephantis]|uniref:hypothetical protein n=1 Tax=Mycoplasma elephantis TaxID=114882 RepID=UPI0004879A0C|nr:hypothetical protein [Mycoplasma elephantis]